MAKANSTSRLIDLAATMVGEAEVLKAMRSSQADFDFYRAGKKEAPYDELGRLVEVIVKEQQNFITKNRELVSKLHGKS